MTINVGFTYMTDLSEEEKKVISQNTDQNRKAAYEFSREYGGTFVKGVFWGAMTAPSLACAKDELDELTRAARRKARIEAVRRVSNTAACGAIIAACKGPAAEKVAGQVVEKGVDVGAKIAAAPGTPVGAKAAIFMCGACLAWCAKYTIFDK